MTSIIGTMEPNSGVVAPGTWVCPLGILCMFCPLGPLWVMLDSVTVPELEEEVVALSSGILKSVELSGSTELRSLELSLALCANAFFIKLNSMLLAELL